jgi:hypothetical protein
MERLTERHCGVAVIKDKNRDKEAMQRLAEYEDLDVTPEQLRQIDALYSELAKELADERKKHEWIPTEKSLPDYDEEVLVTDGKYVWIDTRIQWDVTEDGEMYYWDSDYENIIAWMPLPDSFVNEC